MDITVKEFNNLNLAKKGKKPILCYGCWAKLSTSCWHLLLKDLEESLV